MRPGEDRTLKKDFPKDINFLNLLGLDYLENFINNLGLLLLPYGLVNLDQLAQEKTVVAATIKHRLDQEREAGRREGFAIALGESMSVASVQDPSVDLSVEEVNEVFGEYLREVRR